MASAKDKYVYCITCAMYIDAWKYDSVLDDIGHNGCTLRFATPQEARRQRAECRKARCSR